MKLLITILTTTFVLLITPSLAQDFAVNVNTVAVADGAINLGAGYALDDTHTLHLSTSIRPWARTESSVNKYWSLQPEYKWWNCQKFNGSYWSVYLQGGQFNVGGKEYPFGLASEVSEHRFDGWLIGCGASYGYSWILGKNWNLEASVGVGYDYLDYQKYACPLLCARVINDGYYHYFGVNKLSISFFYLF